MLNFKWDCANAYIHTSICSKGWEGATWRMISFLFIFSFFHFLIPPQKSLRHQDVTLMRQLIGINEKIRDIGREQRSAKCRAKRQRNRSITTTPCLNRQTTKSSRLTSLSSGCFDVIPEVRERSDSVCSSGRETYNQS